MTQRRGPADAFPKFSAAARFLRKSEILSPCAF
jgi:hypothetical protein